MASREVQTEVDVRAGSGSSQRWTERAARGTSSACGRASLWRAMTKAPGDLAVQSDAKGEVGESVCLVLSEVEWAYRWAVV